MNKPAGVPSNAVWDEDDEEWVLAVRNADGELHGSVEYYRADGTLCCRTEYVDGTPHGRFSRYHENGEESRSGSYVDGVLQGINVHTRSTKPTTEVFFDVDSNIWRVEAEYADGEVVGVRAFRRNGEPIDDAGDELAAILREAVKEHDENPSEEWRPTLAPPNRATAVPDSAVWEDEGWRWGVGERTTAGERDGHWRFWAMNGTLVREEHYVDGKMTTGTSYYPSGTVAARTVEQADGVTVHDAYFTDGSPWCSAKYRGDMWDQSGTAQLLFERLYEPNGTLRREITNEYDDTGLVRHEERTKDGTLRFENLRIPNGRELRLYREGKLELYVRTVTGAKEALLVEGNREVRIGADHLNEASRRADVEAELPRRAYEALIGATPRPAIVATFAAKNGWASKVDKEAPIAQASIANFLTGITSTVPLVVDASALGLFHMLGDLTDKRRANVMLVLETLASTPEYAAGATRVLKSLADAEEDLEQVDDDNDEPEEEVTIGTVTVPSGDLAIVDMGAMGQWSHEDPHHADISGSSWAGVANAKRDDYVDLVVSGEQASAAVAAFTRKHGATNLFDLEKQMVAGVQKKFRKLVQEEGLRAELEISPTRIGHGARLRLLKAAGLQHVELGFAHVNVVALFGLPTNRELSVVGTRDDDGCWASVSLVCKPDSSVVEERIEVLGVEEARFMFADVEALRSWDHERSLDGLRDLVFWGGDEDVVAEELGARELAGGYWGWTDLPGVCPPHLTRRILEVAAEGALTVEVRPHSSHHAILQGVWSSPFEAGTALIGGAKVCGLMSSVGDGGFPVFLEKDAVGNICRITVKITAAEDDDADGDVEDQDDHDE